MSRTTTQTTRHDAKDFQLDRDIVIYISLDLLLDCLFRSNSCFVAALDMSANIQTTFSYVKKKNRKSLTDERRERIGHFCLFPVISDTKNLNLELVVCWLHILTVFVSLRKGRDRRVDNGRLCATHSRCRD